MSDSTLNQNSGDSQSNKIKVVVLCHWSGEVTFKCFFCKEIINVARRKENKELAVTFTDSYIEEVWNDHAKEQHTELETVCTCTDCGHKGTHATMFPSPAGERKTIYCEKCILTKFRR